MKSATLGSIFVYGTLMAPEVVQTLLRRLPNATPALVKGFVRHPVRNHVFPGLLEDDSTSVTNGIFYEGLSSTEVQRLDWFEDVEYTRRDVTVFLPGEKTRKTQVYLWTNSQAELNLDQEWDYDSFRKNHLEWYLQHTVCPCCDEIDRQGIR